MLLFGRWHDSGNDVYLQYGDLEDINVSEMKIVNQ